MALQKINDYAVSVKEEQHFQADEYLYLNLLKEALDSGDCSKLLNYLEHNIKFISEDTSTTILCYAVLDALQRLTAGKDTGNSTAQTFLVKITGRKTAADSQTIKTGQQALAVSRGGFQEIDLLLTIEIVQNKIVALQFVHGSNYMLEELEPLKEICLHNRQSLAVPLTGCSIEEWAAFFQDWAEGRTGGQNGLQQLYAALADHCKMTILGKCRSPYGLMVKNVNNKEAICQRLQEFMRTAGKCLKDEGNILIWNDFELLFVVDANGRIAGLQIQLRKELAGPLR